MSDKKGPSREEDLAGVARLAGIALSAEFAPTILARLDELRDGVLSFANTINDETAPAIRFIAG